jgi:hypothetical protein
MDFIKKAADSLKGGHKDAAAQPQAQGQAAAQGGEQQDYVDKGRISSQ